MDRDDPYQLNKKALLDLFKLLNNNDKYTPNKELLRSLFAKEDGSPLVFFAGNYQNLRTNGCCYNELEKIVDNLKSSM